MTRMRRKTSSSLPLLLILAIPLAVAQKKPAPHAVIAGTVFRDPGFALPDAEVTLSRKDDSKSKKLQRATTSFRGEFAFEVPPASATYVVSASRKGFRPEQKEASVSGEERIEVTLTLEPESK